MCFRGKYFLALPGLRSKLHHKHTEDIHNANTRAASLAGILLLSLATAVVAEDQFKDVEIKATKVGDGVYMLTGQGGNIGVSTGTDGVFLIDDQFAPLTKK